MALLCQIGTNAMFLLPLFQERCGMARWEIGLAGGAYSLAAILVRLRLGGWMERYGYRRFVVWGSLLAAVCTFLYPRAGASLGLECLLRALQGLAVASYFTALWARTVAVAPPNRVNELSGWFGISGLLSWALGPWLAEAVLQRSDFFTVFMVAGAVALVGALPTPLLSDPELSPASPPPFWGLLREPRLAGALGGSLIFGLALGTFSTFIAPYAASCGALVTPAFVAYATASVGIRLVGGRWADRVGPELLVTAAMLLVGGGMLVASRLTAGLLLVVGALVGSGHGLGYPAFSTLTNRRVAGAPGMATSVFMAAMETGLLLGATLSGLVAQRWGYPTAFGAVGAVLLPGALVFWVRERGVRS